MTYTTLRQAVYKIRENAPFTGNSLTGYQAFDYDTFKKHNNCASRDWYIVKSYAEPIYTECRACGRYWYNREHYSVTTSRHQSVVRQAKGIQYHAEPGRLCKACNVTHRIKK